MSDEWEYLGAAESALARVLPPYRELMRNKKTGEQRVLFVGIDESIGEAIAAGHWEDTWDDAARQEGDTPEAQGEGVFAARFGNDEPQEKQQESQDRKDRHQDKPRRRSGRYVHWYWTPSGDGAGDGAAVAYGDIGWLGRFALLGLHVLGAGVFVFCVLGAESEPPGSFLWWLYLAGALLTLILALRVAIVALVLGALWLVVLSLLGVDFDGYR